jgi:hypothetical protein
LGDLRCSDLQLYGVGREVGEEGGDLPLFRRRSSNMRSRDDSKMGRSGAARDRDSDDVIGR